MAKLKVINPHNFEKLIITVDSMSFEMLNKIFVNEVSNKTIAIKEVTFEDLITVFYSAYSQGGNIYIVFIDNYKYLEKKEKIEKLIRRDFSDSIINNLTNNIKFGKVNISISWIVNSKLDNSLKGVSFKFYRCQVA